MSPRPSAKGAAGSRGFVASLRAGLEAGARSGFLVGLFDALLALGLAAYEGQPYGLATSLGCATASTLVYGVVWMALGLVAGALLHVVLRARDYRGRTAVLAALGLGLGAFLEIYWWTRPVVFYGRPAFSPERIAASLGLLVVGLVVGALLVRLGARLPRRTRAGFPFAVVFTWLAGAVFLVSESSVGEHRGALSERNRERPNVLLIVVDALRQDVLGCYGNERVETPVVDGLAERGVVFENARVQAPFTWSSFGSLLTGKYPRRHGLVKMAAGVRMLPNVTIPWHLKGAALKDGGGTMRDEDWASGTFMTGTLSNGSGLMRGFDTYFEALVGHEVVHLDSAWSRLRSDLLLFRVKNKLGQKLDSGLVVTTAQDWLASIRGRRFVAMVHLYSTHTPYDPPQRFRDLYCDPAYDGPIGAFYAGSREAIDRGDYVATAADEQQIRNLYYAGTTQADWMIGQVLDQLRAQGTLDDTLVLVTSDHGESLGEQRVGAAGERGLWEHNWMYQTNLAIPLVMSWPKGLPSGVRVRAIVDSIDVLPTICDALGLELPDSSREPEYDRVDGTSLLPLVRGELESVRALSFAENGRYLAAHDLEWKLILPARSVLLPGKSAASDGHTDESGRLFDLAADPGEHANLFEAARDGSDPRAAAALERLLAGLRAWDEELPIPRATIVRSHRDDEAAQNLEALGYSDGVGGDFDLVEPGARGTEEPRD